MRPAVEAEKLGIPGLVITTTGFTELARLAGKASGFQGLRISEYPGPVGIHTPEEIRENVAKVLFDQIIAGLTGSPQVGKVTASSTVWKPRAIVFSGTFEQVHDFFDGQGWTDGLPVVPPTMARVEEFLKHSGYAPDEEIAILPRANLKAVAWNIAANAVMAGCRPEHMPLIVAAVEALGDEKFNLGNIGSTSGLVPYLLFNGPIVRQLGIEYGGQLICKGPNPAIGRAIGLIVKNIAGYRPGKGYMGTFGYPLVFAVAEDEGASPWEPFHVEHGFDAKASTVTVGIANSWGPALAPNSTPDKGGAQITLEMLCRELPKKARLVLFPERGPEAKNVMITIMLSSAVAKTLAGSGYSKQDVKQYVCDNARMSLREFDWAAKYGSYALHRSVREHAEAGVYSEEFLGNPDDMVRILSGPEIVHIVVCGDPNRNRVMTLEGGQAQPVTREISLPANWGALLEKSRGPHPRKSTG